MFRVFYDKNCYHRAWNGATAAVNREGQAWEGTAGGGMVHFDTEGYGWKWKDTSGHGRVQLAKKEYS